MHVITVLVVERNLNERLSRLSSGMVYVVRVPTAASYRLSKDWKKQWNTLILSADAYDAPISTAVLNHTIKHCSSNLENVVTNKQTRRITKCLHCKVSG